MKKTILVSSMLFALTLSATIQAQGHGEERERGGIRVHDREREPDYIC